MFNCKFSNNIDRLTDIDFVSIILFRYKVDALFIQYMC